MEQVLQVMYFCDAAYCGLARVESPAIGTALEFDGSVRGVFRVTVATSRAAQMTADFLAIDVSEVRPDQIQSTVTEFANVACGATMHAWLPDADLHFSAPYGFSVDIPPPEPYHCFAVSEQWPEMGVEVELSSN
jgi:hypothetical protein